MHIRIILFLLLLLQACTSGNEKSSIFPGTDTDSIPGQADTLHVATMYGSLSYFISRDEEMGYDYEQVQDLTEMIGRPFRMHVFNTFEEMTSALQTHEVELVAYSCPVNSELKSRFSFVAYQDDSYPVLVQRIGVNMVTSIDELRGKEVVAIEKSIAGRRLETLNRETNAGLKIKTLSDTVTADQLIEMVSDGKIRYAVADDRTALLHKIYDRRLDCRLALGFQHRNGWMVNAGNETLADTVVYWRKLPQTQLLRSELYEKYLIRNPYFASAKVKIPKGAISPYDNIFKKYASEIKWDWRMLAALAFHESGFDSTQISRKGAAGLMQLMPRTAAVFGLNSVTIFNPEKNIDAGVQYIKSLNLLFRKVEDPDERIKFILASYNSGPAHVMDAMALAEKYGKNPHVWFGHVEYFLSKKNEPEYYNDEVVKFGAFRPGVTIQYVKNVLNTYHKYKGGV